MDSILLDTLNRKTTSRPPVWFMRQAGRVLPSYLALKEKHSFWHMMQNPQLAAEVTLLPIHDLGVDAAILFSDILVVPYAMGMGLDFTDDGPIFDRPLAFVDNPASVLNPDVSKLDYIYDAIDEIVKRKPVDIPLIGFCGAPLTVMLYMLQGLGRKAEFPDATKFIFSNKKEAQLIIDAVTEVSLQYLTSQAKHGIDVFQLFDTHAGIIPFDLYKELFFPSIKRIAQKARELGLPFIYFPKGIGVGLSEITPDYADFVSVDWQTPLSLARKLTHKEIGLQGNLDPRVLYASQAEIEIVLQKYLEFGKQNQDWIFNLGHGFMPGIPYANALFVANWVKGANWG